MKIDADVHFWKYEKTLTNNLIRDNKIMQQHYLPEQIMQSLHRNAIDGCMAVAAEETEVESRFLSELAATHPEILGVVAWINLSDNKSADKVREFLQYPAIKGYRLKDAVRPSDEVMELMKVHQFNLEILLNKNASEFSWLENFPSHSFVISTAGSPDTKKPPAKEWTETVSALGKLPNVAVKLDGLFESGNWKSWKPAEFYPFLEILFEAFGTDRVLYGSNWPFILLSGMYVQWKSLLEKFMENFSSDDRDKFFGNNASRIYRL